MRGPSALLAAWVCAVAGLGVGCAASAHSGWSVTTRQRAREHAGLAGMTAHAALYGAQILVAVDEVVKAAAGAPTAALAAQRATLAARTLADLSGEPLPTDQRRLGEALVALDYALADLSDLPAGSPDLRARVALVQALLAHLRLDLRALWAVEPPA